MYDYNSTKTFKIGYHRNSKPNIPIIGLEANAFEVTKMVLK
jgi:hypothetical protein